MKKRRPHNNNVGHHNLSMKILKYILLIVVGPLVTLLLYVSSENDMALPDILKLGIIIYIFGLVTAIISGGLFFLKASFQQSMKLSIIASELLYLVGLFIFFYIDDKARAENLMWLPVAAIFVVLYSLPMVLSVTYGTGKIISLVVNEST